MVGPSVSSWESIPLIESTDNPCVRRSGVSHCHAEMTYNIPRKEEKVWKKEICNTQRTPRWIYQSPGCSGWWKHSGHQEGILSWMQYIECHQPGDSWFGKLLYCLMNKKVIRRTEGDESTHVNDISGRKEPLAILTSPHIKAPIVQYWY